VESLQDDPVGPRADRESYRSPVNLQHDLTARVWSRGKLRPILEQVVAAHAGNNQRKQEMAGAATLAKGARELDLTR